MLRTLRRATTPAACRAISGQAPTLYLRPRAALPAAGAPADLRARLYALQRYAKKCEEEDAGHKQLDLVQKVREKTDGVSVAPPSMAARRQWLHELVPLLEPCRDFSRGQAAGTAPARMKDTERYQAYLDAPDGVAQLQREVAQKQEAQRRLIPLLDRYPDFKVERVPEVVDTLMQRLDAAHAILSKTVGEVTDGEAHEMYFETSKFQVLEVYTGCVASFPDGDVPPGAIECLPGQCIRTKVNGEDVMLEIDEIDPGYQVCWFKPDVPLPSDATVLWAYPHEPQAVVPTGTTWDDTQADVLLPEPEPPAPQWPVRAHDNPYAPLLRRLEGGAAAAAPLLQEALLFPGRLLPLDQDYESSHDRELVEAKRGRYHRALAAAGRPPAPLQGLDPLYLQMCHNINKSLLVDYLRTAEYRIANDQLEARIHERRLQGDYVDELEEMDYFPHMRDEWHLDNDFYDPQHGRYEQMLYPHLKNHDDWLNQDTRLEQLAYVGPPKNPLQAVRLLELWAQPPHRVLEARLLADLATSAAPALEA